MKLYLTGGFLNSGKTTAIYNACHILMNRGIKVGVITNDQGNQLIDTKFLSGGNIPALEVPDGCFCCNYKQLDLEIHSLQKSIHPEIIFAEPVGSCTDLIATVVKPFMKFNRQIEVVLSVFADASVLHTLIQGKSLFIESVTYIYKKQLEEADLLVINKIDLLTSREVEEIKAAIKYEYPNKKVIYQNSLENDSIQNWLSSLNTFKQNERKSLDIDYQIYGSGEAELAWLDAQVEIYTIENDAVGCAILLINKIYSQINNLQLPIGHLKFLIDDGMRQKKISISSINEHVLKYELIDFSSKMMKVLINARVQTNADQLKRIVTDAILELALSVDGKVLENRIAAFEPGYPKPAYRILN